MSEEGDTEQEISAKIDQMVQDYFTESYICTDNGLYGGRWFESGHNYSGITAWSSLTEDDRAHFTFNYDALDLLIDTLYRGNAKYYDSSTGTDAILYALEKPVDYSARYTASLPLTSNGA